MRRLTMRLPGQPGGAVTAVGLGDDNLAVAGFAALQGGELAAVQMAAAAEAVQLAGQPGLDADEQQVGAHVSASSGWSSRLRPTQVRSSWVVGAMTWAARASRSSRCSRLPSR